MARKHDLTDNEKELLTVLGRNPEMSMKELVSQTKYRWTSSIVKKIRWFRDQDILAGPVCIVDCGKLCRNVVRRLFCIIEFDQSYETVTEYLSLIEPLISIYLELSSHKKLLGAVFFSSDPEQVTALLQILKDNNIITDFLVRVQHHKKIFENPNFFGDPVPSLDGLLDSCEFPDTSYGSHTVEWSECDIRTLSHLQGGYKSIKLIEILKKERKLKRTWTYEQIKYSYQKMTENKLIRKLYYIVPYSLDMCADFYLFIKTDSEDLTSTILYNFARGGRVYKEYSFCDDWGLVGCVCHPHFVIDLMHKLDHVDVITEKELYHLRSFPPGIQYMGRHAEFTYFDVETQTLQYPYHIFKEKIKEKLESEM